MSCELLSCLLLGDAQVEDLTSMLPGVSDLLQEIADLRPQGPGCLWGCHVALVRFFLAHDLAGPALRQADELVITRLCEERNLDPMDRETRADMRSGLEQSVHSVEWMQAWDRIGQPDGGPGAVTHLLDCMLDAAVLEPTRPRPVDEILADAERLVLAWKEGTEGRIDALRQELQGAHPHRIELFDAFMARRERGRGLLRAAYTLGEGHAQDHWLNLIQQAEALGIRDLILAMHENRAKGEKARERRSAEQARKRSGQALSQVQPRAVAERPVQAPPPTAQRRPPPPSAQIHPNDIRALSPCRHWLLLLDETGTDFGETSHARTRGRFVGLLVNRDAPGLAPLPSGWHAVDCADAAEIDQAVQAVLDAPCGVIGLDVQALPTARGERWLDGMRAVIDWVLRLLPIDGDTDLHVAIEGRPPFPPRSHVEPLVRDASAMLARAWPDRARRIRLSIDVIGKDQHRGNGYVDALAFTWGSPTESSRERLRRSGLEGSCFLHFDARDLASCWDHLDALSPQRWNDLVRSGDARHPSSVAHAILDALSQEVRTDPARWQACLDEALRQIHDRSPDLFAVEAMVDWLEQARPNEEKLVAPLRLAWLTAKLARINHFGETERAWLEELRALSERLLEEDAPLCCLADLHLAVNATNRFAFDEAAGILECWSEMAPLVTGLRNWGRLRSSVGQIRAFLGDLEGSVEAFGEALDAFGRLSDARVGEREKSQTHCYLAIAVMDDPEVLNSEDWVSRVTGPLAEAAPRLARSGHPGDVFAHHLLLRWLVNRGDPAIAALYLGEQGSWQVGQGHPWPLIQLYRGLLLRDDAPMAATERVLDAAWRGLDSDQGPTVHFIGACCRAVAAAWGEPWIDAEATLSRLVERLPLAKPNVEVVRSFLVEPGDVRVFIARALPFNFR